MSDFRARKKFMCNLNLFINLGSTIINNVLPAINVLDKPRDYVHTHIFRHTRTVIFIYTYMYVYVCVFKCVIMNVYLILFIFYDKVCKFRHKKWISKNTRTEIHREKKRGGKREREKERKRA